MTLRSFQGCQPQLGQRVLIDPSAVVLGDVQIGDDSSIWPLVVVRGDTHRIRIGQRSSIQDGTVLHTTHAGPYSPDGYPLQIGDQVTVGHQAMLHGCTIGDRVLIGMGAMVMDGAIIETEVVLGAGSLVPPGKTLASGYLYVGRPAKPVRPLSPQEIDYFAYTANNYVKLKDQHLQEQAASAD